MQLTNLLNNYFAGKYKNLKDYLFKLGIPKNKDLKLTNEELFFTILSLLVINETGHVAEVEKKDINDYISKGLKKFESFSLENPRIYTHKFIIIKAGLSGLNGKIKDAISLLDKAIADCKLNNFILEEGIAQELAGSLWYKQGKEIYQKAHLKEAYRCYTNWGLSSKIDSLEKEYVFLKKEKFTSENTTISDTSTSEKLDLDTVLQASRAISGEIELDKLLKKMLEILFANAGAERGFFIYKSNREWLIQAEGNANSKDIKVLQAIPLDSINSESSEPSEWSLSPNIVNYVIRKNSMLLLNDASNKGLFINDNYVIAKKPKSILCYPIINKNILCGIIYLENNLTTDAFTSERVEILKILSSQIAISMENSILYENLEEKVEERTRDLNNALVEVRGLKEQQDMDYYLNTLLIEPLTLNNAKSGLVEIEFLIKQKKNFIFRDEKYELGGDINLSENIKLFGRQYTVFLNGDAMGKSIQGAGGVLVLGTIFKSIIQRTISTDYGKNTHPERWLKNAFIEMHKAFESFDGSMLMSTVYGLIDESAGVMYFINVEHPDPVLYRDGIASFLKSQYRYRKLGSQLEAGSIAVTLFTLKQNDVIIIGSDGKDDLIIGRNEDTNRELINHDEGMFLQYVKDADGQLNKIYEDILRNAKLKDDLSLLRILYKNNNDCPDILQTSLDQLKTYKIENNYEKYYSLGKEIIFQYPQLTEVLIELTNVCIKMMLYEEAINCGEKVRLREPKNFNNLMNLFKAYSELGRKERAGVILNACIRLRPD
ncbi:MAG: SpoIIE family protein phosphatase, partial [Leptospiraceae bacterium]|nr:SpoIIE family protein phosphatase [Leptospiraceae bacterium]